MSEVILRGSRYLVFEDHYYEPSGGAYDLIGIYDDIDDIRAILDSKLSGGRYDPDSIIVIDTHMAKISAYVYDRKKDRVTEDFIEQFIKDERQATK